MLFLLGNFLEALMLFSFLGLFLGGFLGNGNLEWVNPNGQNLQDEKKHVCFVACHTGPASHFEVYAKELTKRGYSVEIRATGPALQKLQESSSLKIEPFFLEQGKEEQEAEKIAKINKASLVITDVGHVFDIFLQKALKRVSPLVRRVAYYDNPEAYVPGGYSEVASQVIKQAQKVVFANQFLAKKPIYEAPYKALELSYENRIGLGYYPLEGAQEIEKRKGQKEIRSQFFTEAKLEDIGQKVFVYVGGNNEVYFSRALPSFLEFITGLSKQKDLSATLLILQQHPGAKVEDKDALYLQSWVEKEKRNSFFPTCIISKGKTEEVLALADAVFYYQTSMAPQFVLAGIPTAQIGDMPFEDILVKNGLCRVVNSIPDLVETYEAFQEKKDHRVDRDEIKKKLGIDPFWANTLEELIR